VQYVPGLYKIFDEILVNAADNYVRDPDNMTFIKVSIDEKAGCISVENNGQTLPLEVHQEHKVYVPELVFGHLLTSDNYDDDEKKVVGGRNGYGAKLTNIFSSKFQVECGDSECKKRYTQVWEGNMQSKQKPSLSAHQGGSFTKVTFWPDLPRFSMKKLDKDILAIMKRRVYDIAGATPKTCKVYLNGKAAEVKDFKDYVNMYLNDDTPEIVYEQCSDRWEIAMTVSDGQFQQVSFVNSIFTAKGGTHVAHVADQLVEAILKRVNAKNRGGMEVKPYHVRNYLWLFVNAKIENPSFDSQTKETMTLKAAKFGSKCDVSDGMVNRVLKTGIVDMILQWAKAKEEIDLGKNMKSSQPSKGKTRRLLNIPKLEDANMAGGSSGHECTLILTEGDSAKSLAVAGLSIIGRDKFGVFPLRGKLLNVRDATFKQTMDNAEIANITKILGLEPKKTYTSARGLRYGHIMVMADQDYDGSHIKGLILNLIQHWWPSLFKLPGFMQEFVTPIVKVTRRGTSQQFFTLSEYEAWKMENNNGKGWVMKYYKGLGTSTTQEAKEYFKNINEHSLDFEYVDDADDEKIDLAFNKKRADDRKEWINSADDDEYVDHSQASLKYTDFVQKELVLFARYDVMRNIPCVVDGLKPVQRKIIWACFKRNLKSDIKVAQLTGFVSEQAAYHHGEMSLSAAIVSLAQNYVGSNNLNLLTPSGQFGTRLQGGKDHASARYIYTRLEPVARLVFHPDDDKLLEYLDDEGLRIEPRWYMPVLPMLLINGAEGIGTGWSTSCPNYDPRDIIDNVKRYLRCQKMKRMCPWYRGFMGSILPSLEKDSYEFTGNIEKRSATTLEITELPVRKWTQDFKELLQSMLPFAEGQGSGTIEDFKEFHTETKVHFVITTTEAQMTALERKGFEHSFKLRTSMPTSNIVLFDKKGQIRKYSNELEILEDFCELRLEYYHKRKAWQLRTLMQQLEVLAERVRFIFLVIEEKLKVRNRKREALIQDLRSNHFRTLQEITDDADMDIPGDALAEPGEVKAGKQRGGGGWEYLLGMPLWSLTIERIEQLNKQRDEKKAQVETLKLTAPEEIWERDLDAILDELDAIDARAHISVEEERRFRAAAQKRASSNLFGAAKRRRAGPMTLAAGGVSAVPAPAGSPGKVSKDSLAALQGRHLRLTAAAFPGLFDSFLPDAAEKGDRSVAAGESRAPSLGKFAQKAQQSLGKGRLRTPGSAADGAQQPEAKKAKQS